VLLFPNAWDVASARIVEQAGFPAVATSSAGVANVLGYADGERISRAEMLDMVRRIAASVAVPVTADMEAGFGVTPEAAADSSRGCLPRGRSGLRVRAVRRGSRGDRPACAGDSRAFERAGHAGIAAARRSGADGRAARQSRLRAVAGRVRTAAAVRVGAEDTW